MLNKPFIVHETGSKRCLPKSIVLGLAYVKRNKNEKSWKKWRRLSRYAGPLDMAAKKLMAKAGITKNRFYDAGDIAAFQKFLPSIQIIAYADEYRRKPLFTGKFVGDENILGLRLKSGHFDHVKRLGAYHGQNWFYQTNFSGCHYFCGKCLKKYSTRNTHYKCTIQCRLCLHRNKEECEGKDELRCTKCDRIFGWRFSLSLRLIDRYFAMLLSSSRIWSSRRKASLQNRSKM